MLLRLLENEGELSGEVGICGLPYHNQSLPARVLARARSINFGPNRPVATQRWAINGTDASWYKELFILLDYYPNSSESVNPVLPCADLNSARDSLNFAYKIYDYFSYATV